MKYVDKNESQKYFQQQLQTLPVAKLSGHELELTLVRTFLLCL